MTTGAGWRQIDTNTHDGEVVHLRNAAGDEYLGLWYINGWCARLASRYRYLGYALFNDGHQPVEWRPLSEQERESLWGELGGWNAAIEHARGEANQNKNYRMKEPA